MPLGNGGDRVALAHTIDRNWLLTHVQERMRNTGVIRQTVLPFMGRQANGIPGRDILKAPDHGRSQGGIEVVQEAAILEQYD